MQAIWIGKGKAVHFFLQSDKLEDFDLVRKKKLYAKICPKKAIISSYTDVRKYQD